MLKYSKISEYKIKKILKCYVDDLTATEAAKNVHINRHTVERYYREFRKSIKLLYAELIMEKSNDIKYLGYVKAYYGHKKYLDVYKYEKKLFSVILLGEQPNHKKQASRDEDFKAMVNFFYRRATKFYGFTMDGYNYQLLEANIRFYYSKGELYDKILKDLKVKILL